MVRRQRAWRRTPSAEQRSLVAAAVALAGIEPLPGVDRIAALRDAFDLAVPASLPTLAPLAFSSDRAVAVVAEAGVRRLLGAMQSWEYAALDRELRTSTLREDVTLGSLTGTANRARDPGVLLGIAACHPDGRVRMSALQSADHWNVDVPLGLLLVRLDDWVLPVRRLARRRVLARLDLENVPALVAALPLMERLAGRRRVQKDKALRWIEQLLRDATARSGLWRGLESEEVAVQRSTISLLVEATDIDVLRMLVASTRRDPFVARTAADAVIATLESVPDELLRSRVGQVRVRALLALSEPPTPEGLGALRSALMDPLRSVREVAVFHLRKRGATHIAARYREAAEVAGRSRRIAVLGLGETGSATDIPLLTGLLSRDHDPSLARAALGSICRLDPKGQVELLLAHLDDPRPGVSREARTALQASRRVASPEALWGIVQTAENTHGSRNAFRVLARARLWQSAAYLLRGADHTDPWIAAHAAQALERWGAGRSASVPPISSQERQAVETALAGRGRGVPERIAARMRDMLAAAPA